MTRQATPPETIAALPLTAFVRTAFSAAECLPAKAAAAAPAGADVPLRRSAAVTEIATLCATNAVGTAELLSVRPTPDVLDDIVAMQAAFMRQIWSIDLEWRTGLMRIAEGALALRKANTVSKIMEQDLNLVGQYGDLMTVYATRTAALIENASVGYSFWLSKKVKEMQAGTAAS
ncbi:hypothetical protein [Methylobacterium aquaticum]|uniref:hypothetical protein n=1 Tax=Methylobacterium aquaticum TaxID=270351 RepID=UPI00193264E2|nr:hypothetical protein [Methylobacterium aquaticum]QRE72559.1 hypothetical protein F1D61_01605 [Methylobacterium aquaticum]